MVHGVGRDVHVVASLGRPTAHVDGTWGGLTMGHNVHIAVSLSQPTAHIDGT